MISTFVKSVVVALYFLTRNGLLSSGKIVLIKYTQKNVYPSVVLSCMMYSSCV